MYTQRSDTSKNTAASHKATVRQFLRAHDEVASKDKLRAGTDVPAWYIDQIASTNTFYTSLNHNGQYVAAKHVVGHRATHDGFWRPEVDDGVAVFHRKETTKATLKHLAFQRPSGITAPEANDSSIDAVTVRSGTSPTNRRSTLSNTGTRRSTSTAGRPCGTPS